MAGPRVSVALRALWTCPEASFRHRGVTGADAATRAGREVPEGNCRTDWFGRRDGDETPWSGAPIQGPKVNGSLGIVVAEIFATMGSMARARNTSQLPPPCMGPSPKTRAYLQSEE